MYVHETKVAKSRDI